MVYDFNAYSKENGLNIIIDLNLFSTSNSTGEVLDYEATLDYHLSRGSDKYDLVFFDNIFTSRFGPYLLDLNGIVEQEHLDKYMEGVASQTCVYKNKIVGLVITLLFIIYYLLFIIYY